MKKISMGLLAFIALSFFSFFSVHAVTQSYDVMQFSKKMGSFSTLSAAKTFSTTLEYTTIYEQPGNKLVLSNLPVGYGVFQNNQLIGNFSTLDNAIAKADTLDFAYVVDANTWLWVWDNIPNYDVLDANGNKLVSKGFKYLPDAFNFTQSHSNSQLKSLVSTEILWKNAAPVSSSSQMVVSASTLNVRSGPSTEFPVISSLTQGQSLQLLSTGGTWNKISLSNGLTGFVYSSYISVGTPSNPANPNGKTVILDAGHGGHDPGSVGIGGFQEKVATLNYAMATKTALEAKGYIVVLTRTGDTDCKTPFTTTNLELGCRAKVSKNYSNSIFISIHANWDYTGSARGTETYYNANNDYDGYMNAFPAKSKLLSDSVHKYVQSTFGSLDRKSKDSSYYVLRFNSVPAILIELGFLTNADDLAKIKSTTMQAAIANAIVSGVNEYFSKG